MNFLRKLVLLLIVLVVIAVVVAVTCPAEFAYRLLGDRLGVLRLAGISGSLWHGQASSTQVFDQELGALDWQLDAAALLELELRAQLSLSGGDVTAAGIATRNPDGTIAVRDASFAFPARLAAPALDIPALTLLGQIDGKLSQARLHNAWLEAASGSARWHNAAVAGSVQAQFGDLEATFSSAPDGAIVGEVHDLGGPLQLKGTFKVSAGSFDADTQLAARDGNPQVVEALHYIGQLQADGSSHLLVHGTLFKLN